MPYVTVLDFDVGKTYIYKYSDEIEDIEDFIDSKNHQLSNCQYMCTDELELEIK